MFGQNIKRVVILGCGPAGIFAAHAATLAEKEVLIYSRKRRSEMYGAQYLHMPIAGLTAKPPVMVRYSLIGTPDQYAAKVYGDERPPFVSPESLLGEHRAWDIREAYHAGWDLYRDAIVDIRNIDSRAFTTQHDAAQKDIYQHYCDAKHTQIISTLPAPLLCYQKGKHEFRARSIWAAGEAPERGQFLDMTIAPNSVSCCGEKSPSWYRASNVFGYKTVEWPFSDRKPPVEGVTEVTKVISNNCNCLQPRVWRAGRNGTWDKKVLSHHAFQMVDHVFSGVKA